MAYFLLTVVTMQYVLLLMLAALFAIIFDLIGVL